MIVYPITTKDKPISALRTKRLLLIADKPRWFHKRMYHQYYYLAGLGLISWVIGSASLTQKGQNELEALQRKF